MKSNVLYLSRRRKTEPRAEPSSEILSGIVSVVGDSKIESIYARHSALLLSFQEGRTVRWEADSDNGNVSLSAGWKDMLGESELMQFGRDWLSLLHPDDRFEAIMTRMRGRMTDRPYHCVSRCLIHGVYAPVLRSAYPLVFENGEAVRWAGHWQLWATEKAVNF